jgi:hypothetical protein
MSPLDQIAEQIGINVWVLLLAVAWSLVWKALALWKSARKNSPIWFIMLLLINTLGILEILYIFLFSELKLEDKRPKIKKKPRKR